MECPIGSCQRHGKCMYTGHPQCPDRQTHTVAIGARQHGKTAAAVQAARASMSKFTADKPLYVGKYMMAALRREPDLADMMDHVREIPDMVDVKHKPMSRRDLVIQYGMVLWLAEHVPNPTELHVRPDEWKRIRKEERRAVDKSLNAAGDRYLGLLVVVDRKLAEPWKVV